MPSQPFMPSQAPLVHSLFGMLAPLGSVTAWLEFDLQPKENAISVAQRRRFFIRGSSAAAAACGNRIGSRGGSHPLPGLSGPRSEPPAYGKLAGPGVGTT